jgi:hypothetical protein
MSNEVTYRSLIFASKINEFIINTQKKPLNISLPPKNPFQRYGKEANPLNNIQIRQVARLNLIILERSSAEASDFPGQLHLHGNADAGRTRRTDQQQHV